MAIFNSFLYVHQRVTSINSQILEEFTAFQQKPGDT